MADEPIKADFDKKIWKQPTGAASLASLPFVRGKMDVIAAETFRMGIMIENGETYITVLFNDKLPYLVLHRDMAKMLAEQLDARANRKRMEET